MVFHEVRGFPISGGYEIFLYGPYRNLYNSYRFFLERGPLNDYRYRQDLCWLSRDV